MHDPPPCPSRSSPAPRADSASRSPALSTSAAGDWSSTPAAEQRSARATEELRGRRRDRRRRRRPGAPRGARRGRRRADRPAGQQRQPARPEPPAAARRLPARRAAPGLRGQRRRAAGARPARAAARSRAGAAILDVTSDAAVEPYEGWGGYGSSKAALEQLTAILGAEHPELRVYAVDPGDMRTQMHQDAFPGEDISDRPPPEDERARTARPDRGRRCRAAATGPRELAPAARRERRPRLAAPARGAEPPEARGADRDDVALLVAGRERRLARPRPLRRASALPRCRATCSSSTRRRRCPPRFRPGSTASALELHLSTPLAATASWVGRAAHRRPPAVRARRRSATRLELPGGAHAELLARLPRQRAARRRAARRCPSRCERYLRRHGRPIRYGVRRRERGRSTPTRRCSRSSPAAPRCRAPGARSPPSSSPSSSPAACSSRR